MDSKIQQRPKIYLDKGALSKADLTAIAKIFDLCYSEAVLLDLKSDKTETKHLELDALNYSNALFLHRIEDMVNIKVTDARHEFANSSSIEVEIMFGIYRFINGGGNSNLFDVASEQFNFLLNEVGEDSALTANSLREMFDSAELDSLKDHTAGDFHRETQKTTNAWNQDSATGLAEVFGKNPELASALAEYFPRKPTGFEQIQLASILLGALHLGRDKGINSPVDQRSKKAVWNGYIDCMHIAYGMYCAVFLTTDKDTLRRYRLLSDYWGLNKISHLI